MSKTLIFFPSQIHVLKGEQADNWRLWNLVYKTCFIPDKSNLVDGITINKNDQRKESYF